jgi:hypothetical protein
VITEPYTKVPGGIRTGAFIKTRAVPRPNAEDGLVTFERVRLVVEPQADAK